MQMHVRASRQESTYNYLPTDWTNMIGGIDELEVALEMAE